MRRLLLLAIVFSHVLVARVDTVVVVTFQNRSGFSNLDWIGESISETIRETLASHDVLALDRERRQEAFRRLSIRPYAPITRASSIKLADELDVTQLIYGEFEFEPDSGAASPPRGLLRLTAKLLNLTELSNGHEITAEGDLEDLGSLQNDLAWRLLELQMPDAVPSREEFQLKHPETPLDAMESYARGLLAATPEQKHRFLTQAVRLDPGLTQASFELGRLQLAKEEYRLAAQWFERVDSHNAHFREATYYLALCKYHMADFAAAQAGFLEVSETVPLNEVWNNLGAAQSSSGHPAALDNFSKALEGDPSDPLYHFNVGYLLWQREDFEAAAVHFQAVLEKDPDDAEASALLERCLRQRGPRLGDPQASGLERVKHNYSELAYQLLKAELEARQR